MHKLPKNSNNKATPKMVAVIKNGHTDAELDEMAERWVNHQGPYLILGALTESYIKRHGRKEILDSVITNSLAE